MKRFTVPFLALYILLANYLDAIFTHQSVASGEATELNPLMNVLLESGLEYFFLVKIGLVSLAMILLLHLPQKKLIKKWLLLAAGIYSCILFIHLSGTF